MSCDGELDVADGVLGLHLGSFDDVLVAADEGLRLDLLEVRVFVMAPSLASCTGKTSSDPFHKKIKQYFKVNYLFFGLFYFSLVNQFSTR